MVVFTASEMNRRPGHVVNISQEEKVIIERDGKPIAVIISYEEFSHMERAIWGMEVEKYPDKDADWVLLDDVLAIRGGRILLKKKENLDD